MSTTRERKTPRFKWLDIVELVDYPQSPLLDTPRYVVLGSEKTWHGLYRYALGRVPRKPVEWYAYEDELKKVNC